MSSGWLAPANFGCERWPSATWCTSWRSTPRRNCGSATKDSTFTCRKKRPSCSETAIRFTEGSATGQSLPRIAA